jgi:ComF family protein
MVSEALAAVAYPAICPLCRRHPARAVANACDDCSKQLSAIPRPWCRDCGGTIDGALDICSECLNSPRPWDEATAALYFAGSARALIHRLKYGNEVTLGPLAARLLAQAVRDRELDFDAIVPVPLHWFRRMRRGYNQSELLAEHLGKELQKPVLQALKRRRSTRPQASLSLGQRKRNLAKAFCIRKADVEGLRLLLVDDVLTTGSTLVACTNQLRKAGATKVIAGVVARG